MGLRRQVELTLDRHTPYFIRRLIRALRYPAGCYYSPIPSLHEIGERAADVFDNPRHSKHVPGIELNEADQLALLDAFQPYYDEQPFPREKICKLRYFFENEYFSYSDAIFLYCMIRHVRPRRIVEVGSGYSSCVLLDTNQLHFENQVRCTFIEPDPRRLRSLLRHDDLSGAELLEKKIQDVPLERFQELSAGDILFIDSSHQSKIGSDVNRILFEILPALRSGVCIHFHDIFWPFEYPKAWVFQGRAFNEGYILRAFLQYNVHFKVVLFNSFLEHFHQDRFRRSMPLCRQYPGRSLWIQKV